MVSIMVSLVITKLAYTKSQMNNHKTAVIKTATDNAPARAFQK